MSDKYTNKVVIREHQKQHYLKLIDILENYFAYLDNSDTGTGKTPMVFAIAQTFDWELVVVCLKSNISDWRNMAEKYGVKIKLIITYQSLQGIDGKQPKHGLLTRKDKKFTPTEQFVQWAKNGLLLVFDEVQKVKNDNAELASAHALVKCIVEEARNGAQSRIALLSATPIDKMEHSSSLLKMLGIITSDKLYEYDRSNKMYNLHGLKEAFEFCKRLDPIRTKYTMSQTINRTNVNKICTELYVNIIKKHLSSAMPPIVVHKDAKNGYYDFVEKDLEKLKKGIDMLSYAINYKYDIDRAGKSSNWGDITTALTIIESAKVNTMIRLAKEKLDTNPNCKVVLYFKYLNNISNAYELLKDYGALYVDGSKNEQERKNARVSFQADNNNYRVIISNAQVNGIGVELDDITGNHPRYMFMIADYRVIEAHQSAGRICRAGSKSVGTIRFVYSKKYPIETSIINAMVRKSQLVRDVIIDQNKDILLPGEYGLEIEGLDDINLISTDPKYEYFKKIWEMSKTRDN